MVLLSQLASPVPQNGTDYCILTVGKFLCALWSRAINNGK